MLQIQSPAEIPKHLPNTLPWNTLKNLEHFEKCENPMSKGTGPKSYPQGPLEKLYQTPAALCSRLALSRFCTQAAGTVMVTSLPSWRNARSTHFHIVKHNDLATFYFKIVSGPLVPLVGSWVPPGCVLGASWVPPGSLLGAPGCLLGLCWVLPGASLVPPGSFLAQGFQTGCQNGSSMRAQGSKSHEKAHRK
jgi:hypothetical protein